MASYYSLLNLFGEFPLFTQHSVGGQVVGTLTAVVAAAVFGLPVGTLWFICHVVSWFVFVLFHCTRNVVSSLACHPVWCKSSRILSLFFVQSNVPQFVLVVIGIIGSGFETEIAKRRTQNKNNTETTTTEEEEDGRIVERGVYTMGHISSGHGFRSAVYNFCFPMTTPCSYIFDTYVINTLVVGTALTFMLDTIDLLPTPRKPVAILPHTEYCARGASPDKFNKVIHIDCGTEL